eukprot:6480600-Pyramimonas_sp.AAC.1
MSRETSRMRHRTVPREPQDSLRRQPKGSKTAREGLSTPDGPRRPRGAPTKAARETQDGSCGTHSNPGKPQGARKMAPQEPMTALIRPN